MPGNKAGVPSGPPPISFFFRVASCNFFPCGTRTLAPLVLLNSPQYSLLQEFSLTDPDLIWPLGSHRLLVYHKIP